MDVVDAGYELLGERGAGLVEAQMEVGWGMGYFVYGVLELG